MQKKVSSVFISFYFALKARLHVLKLEFCQIQVKVEQRIILQLTDIISFQLDFNSSLLLEYDC